MLNRRAFLTSAAALAVTPAIPAQLLAATAPAAVSVTTIWVGGHYGEFDWHPFHAKDRLDALRQLLHYHGWNEEEIGRALTLPEDKLAKELSSAEIDVARAEAMDGLQVDEIKAHHWIRAGMGACCSRCSYECDAESGARAVGEEAVCEECLTLEDKLTLGDNDEVEEELIELMMDYECAEAEVRKVLTRSMDPTVIPAAMWEKCLATARAEL
ncbi:hypothetical protein [Pararhizobium arenae]|uniref:hypothetical protein n=1 Tax=Pararhizobium arenae TaxID=1856850 RepID=UPI00094B401E|nr:hypothetical protein [Pararhizobium arenae]